MLNSVQSIPTTFFQLTASCVAGNKCKWQNNHRGFLEPLTANVHIWPKMNPLTCVEVGIASTYTPYSPDLAPSVDFLF